jgi:hypothetical protein
LGVLFDLGIWARAFAVGVCRLALALGGRDGGMGGYRLGLGLGLGIGDWGMVYE